MPAEEMRTCKKCGVPRPLSEFYQYKSPNTGRLLTSHSCIVCDKIAEHERVVNRRANRRLKGKYPAKYRRDKKKLWDYPLEERCFRNFRYLLEQYELVPRNVGRRRRTIAPTKPSGLRGQILAWIVEGRTVEEISELLRPPQMPAPTTVMPSVGQPNPRTPRPKPGKNNRHLPGNKPGFEHKRTLCGRLITEDIVIVGSGDVTCGMCKKLAAAKKKL